jgi:hypothetical protein
MSCAACDGRLVDWDDDAPEMCDHCLASQLHETARLEPADDPQPNELLPEPESQEIERQRVNPANSKRLLSNFMAVVDHVREHPKDGAIVTDADLLHALGNMIRLYAADTIGERIVPNPTAAVLNAAKIRQTLQTLHDEILQLDLPQPKVN